MSNVREVDAITTTPMAASSFSFGFGGDRTATDVSHASVGIGWATSREPQPSPFGGAAPTTSSSDLPAAGARSIDRVPVRRLEVPAVDLAGCRETVVPLALPAEMPSDAWGAACARVAKAGCRVRHAPSDSGLPRGWAVTERVYEGGLVTWECAADASAACLEAIALRDDGEHTHAVTRALGKALTSTDCCVLELGCGTALPSAVVGSVRAGAGRTTRVVLQDLNDEVLLLRAAPTVCQDGVDCRLVAGEWGDEMHGALRREVGSPQAFVLVASETVYRQSLVEEHVRDILSFLDEAVAGGATHSFAVVAAKRFYFGSGLEGGTSSFVHAVGDLAPTAALHRVKVIDDGRSNVREVWVIQRSSE
jgi:hypothetical protein